MEVVYVVADRSVHYDPDQAAGVAFADGVPVMKPKVVDAVAFQEELVNGKPKGSYAQGSIQTEANPFFKNMNAEIGSSSHCYSEVQNEETKNENEIEEHEQIIMVKNSKLKVADFDLERVLKEQDTHDLYCPKCKARITRRVVLRKRKRSTREEFPSDAPTEKDIGDDEEPDVFGCLSCLCFFIPTENGYNIFRMFEKKEEKQVENSEENSKQKVGWIPSIFNWVKSDKKAKEPGNATMMPVSKGISKTDQITHSAPNLADPNPEEGFSIPANVAAGRKYEWDILKSIVYGGLIESITSLSIVSSAAGANASTFNVVAIGLANLFGGFLLVIHDLWNLKSVQAQDSDQEVEPAGRYWELLGRRRNFRRHFFVSMTSYLLVGLLPPVVYGFSFRKSDIKEYKLIAVAAASFLCIALLAIGKAHVTGKAHVIGNAHVKSQKAYFSTLFYYICLGLSASGLPYVAGAMINRLLAELDLFDHSSAPVPPSLDINWNVPAMASY